MIVGVRLCYFVNISLLFGLRWVAVCCQDVTLLMVRVLKEEGVSALNYIDDLGRMALDVPTSACSVAP